MSASILKTARMLSVTSIRGDGPGFGLRCILPASSSFDRLCTPILLLIFIFFATQAYGQGCAQCLDSTRATPPAVQAAYRHAIYLLGGFAAALFLAALYIFHREP